ANAGANQTITLPVSTVTLTGSGTDADGTIASYQWSKIAGPAQFTITTPSAAQTSVTGLVQGVYQFVLTVTDNSGATGRDTVQVTVNAAAPPPNQAPTANAGANQTITLPVSTATLTGSGTDPDGTIASYQWSKIAGPAQFTITTPSAAQTSVTGLVQGVYQFVLTVTDNSGATGRDTVQVTVNAAAPPPNQVPTANAGANQTITLPVSTVTLTGSGTDADGTIASYQWSKIAGPAQFTITTPSAAQTSVTGLVQGVYQFVLTVTDNSGATGRDTVQVTVNAAAPPPNQAPTANAGANQTITLPVNQVTLSGSGTDPDGSIASYQWSKISGPNQFSISSPGLAISDITNLKEGVYLFELKLTDDRGAIARDTVTVTVLADPRRASTVSIYPNPVTTTLIIELNAVTNVNKTPVTIYNMAGMIVYQNEVLRTQQITILQVDVSNYVKGTYIVKVGLDINHSGVLKFIKH
ncbi:MAG: T9SS type A sorting domain-containing protein, partial [Sphingobacteriales bacterium]|nr:T9SS type A sorting domain-containing protein [Sphingobacteriales bacterium]